MPVNQEQRTGATDPTLVAKLEAYRQQRGWPWAEVARKMGIADSGLSSWRHGTYSTPETMNRRVEKFLAEITQIGQGPVDTQGLLMIHEVCRECQENKGFGVIIGLPGVGKTEALNKYYVENDGVVLVRCDVTTTLFYLLQAILGEEGGGATTAVMMQQAKKRLKGKLLILDEADALNRRALEGMRTLLDTKQLGLLLAGAPQLQRTLTRGPNASESMAQLYSRVDYFITVGNPTEPDLAEYLDRLNIHDTAARRAITKVGHTQSFRAASKLAAQAQRVARLNKAGEVTADHVRAASGIILLKAS